MVKRVLIAAAAALLATASGASAAIATTAISGSYTASASSAQGYLPIINSGTGYLPSTFSENLVLGTSTPTTTFVRVAPIYGNQNVGTVTGKLNVGFDFVGPSGSAVTGVTYSAGDDAAVLAGGIIDVAATYKLFYGNGTDCLTWSSTTCTANDNTTTVGDALAVSFADGAVLDVNLYNWADWDMTPSISFKLVNDPTAVPEPASLALLGTAIVGLGLLRRRGGSANSGGGVSAT